MIFRQNLYIRTKDNTDFVVKQDMVFINDSYNPDYQLIGTISPEYIEVDPETKRKRVIDSNKIKTDHRRFRIEEYLIFKVEKETGKVSIKVIKSPIKNLTRESPYKKEDIRSLFQ